MKLKPFKKLMYNIHIKQRKASTKYGKRWYTKNTKLLFRIRNI